MALKYRSHLPCLGADMKVGEKNGNLQPREMGFPKGKQSVNLPRKAPLLPRPFFISPSILLRPIPRTPVGQGAVGSELSICVGDQCEERGVRV